MDLIWLIPILPGIGAAINGLVGIRSFSRQTAGSGGVRRDDGRARRVSLRVRSAARLAAGGARSRRQSRPLDSADSARDRARDWVVRSALGVPPRSALGDDDPRRHRHRAADPYLFDSLHARRAARRIRALLLLSQPVLLLHARARAGQQLPDHVRRLGRRGPVLVPAHRLLVREEERVGRRKESLHRQPGGRLGLRARCLPGLLHLRHARFPCCRERGRCDAGRGGVRRHLPDLPAPLHRRDRQERADSVVCLAAGRDGRSDAGVGAHPCGHDGDGRCVHGRPQRRALRTRAHRRAKS